MNKLLISGEMRSGTTLLANFLNQQKGITIYRDFLHIEGLMKSIDVNSLADQLTRLQKTKLLYKFNFMDNAKLHFTLNIDDAAFTSLNDFYDLVLQMISKEGDIYVGHKTTRTYDVASQLLKYQPSLKIIYMIRDPRDVVQSALKIIPQQTIYDHIDNWKDASIKLNRLMLYPNSKERILIIHFEELVKNPKKIMGVLNKFLGVDGLIIPKNLTDYKNPWVSNSSIGDIDKIFDKNAVNRWRKVNNRNTEIVEILLSGHMQSAGYEPVLKLSWFHKIYVLMKYFIYVRLREMPMKIGNFLRHVYLKTYLPLIRRIS
jgi:hypothetical protein